MAAALVLFPWITMAEGTVSEPAEASLRSALAKGGRVIFDFDGTIVLSNTVVISTNTVLDATRRQVTVSGNRSVRVFWVNSNVDLTISNLTIAHGISDQGSGVYNAGGRLDLVSCTLVSNCATGQSAVRWSGQSGTNGVGGAVHNLGVLNADNCSFISNSVVGGTGADASSPGAGGTGGDGVGGAIGNDGAAFLTGCLFANNSAAGGAGGAGLFISMGGAGGNGNGGAIGSFGTLVMSGCLLVSNSVTGGAGGLGGEGPYATPAFDGSPGGAGGHGNGGALFTDGSAILVNNTLAGNSGAGGQGGSGGAGGPPASESYSGSGGPGGGGGSGYGAINDLTGQCWLTNCTLALNQAIPGPGGPGGPPGPYDYPGPPRIGSPGANGASGPPGSGLKTAGGLLFNTLLASNAPANGAGPVTDAGHNLSSDASLAMTGPGSMISTDPRLGPLANNGGQTLTMSLLPGSPAIDAGSANGAPAIDQRGVTRPQGMAVDIGALEYRPMPIFTGVLILSATNCRLQLSGFLPNETSRLLVSTNLQDWSAVTNLSADLTGQAGFLDPMPSDCRVRFYRVQLGLP